MYFMFNYLFLLSFYSRKVFSFVILFRDHILETERFRIYIFIETFFLVFIWEISPWIF